MYSVFCRKICEQMLVQGKFKKLGFAKFLKNVKFMKIAKNARICLANHYKLTCSPLSQFYTHAKDDALNFCKGLKGQRKSCLI